MNQLLLRGFKLENRQVRPLQGEITGTDGISHIHPKVMEVLVCLAERPKQVMQRSEILDRVWGHTHGSDKALTRCISELRQALGDRKGQPGLIETIPKRGYRLRAEPEVLNPVATKSMELESDGKPAIAVLPFTNMSGDPSQEYFSDGITEDIITELSRLSALIVIARNSIFTFKGRHVPVQEVSRALGARYVLEGSIRKAGNRIRLTAQLTDGLSGSHIWAERYDRDLTDIFDVQDDLTRQIVSVLAVTLTSENHISQRATGSLEAYEYVVRGRELAWLHKEETGVEAKRLLARAIWLDPGYAAAYSWLAFAHSIDHTNQWGENPDESLQVAQELAHKAVALDGCDAQAHFVLGEGYLWGQRDYARAMSEAKRAIELDPNYSQAYILLGHVFHYTGKSAESIAPFETAMRLDPYYPDLYLHFLAQSLYSLGRYNDAIESLQTRLSRNKDTDISQVLLAACYGQLNQKKAARSAWQSALSTNRNYSLETRRRLLPYQSPADFEHFADGLRKAGLVP